MPKDKEGKQRAFGFITYVHAVSVPYAVELFRGTRLFNRELRVNAREGGGGNSGPPKPNSAHQQMQQQQLHQQHQLMQQHQQKQDKLRFHSTAALQSGFNSGTAMARDHYGMVPTNGRPTKTIPQEVDINALLMMSAQFRQPSVVGDVRPSTTLDNERSGGGKYRHDNRSQHRDRHYPPSSQQHTGNRRNRSPDRSYRQHDNRTSRNGGGGGGGSSGRRR